MTGRPSIVEFLRARLDEDERIARAAESTDWDGTRMVIDERGRYVAVGPYDGDMDEDEVAHIIRWDPARVLAEVETKRRMLVEHEPWENPGPQLADGSVEQPTWCCTTCGASPCDPGLLAPCLTLRLLASPYADHPDYDPAWAPEQAAT